MGSFTSANLPKNPDNLKALANMTTSDLQDVTDSEGNTHAYSDVTSGTTVKLKLAEGTAGNITTFATKAYGGRNDIGGGLDLTNYDRHAGDSQNNTLEIELSKHSQLYAKLLFGGRSAQLEGIDEKVHAGFLTNNNRVIINGGADNITHTASSDEFFTSKETPTLVTKGIFGAEGYEASNNLVSVNNTIIAAGMKTARKLGLVGGRGMYDMRIGENSVDADQTAIANSNVVTIRNSYIGYALSASDNDWNSGTSDWDNGFSIYGGWSTGEAKNNIVSVEDSIINGNIIGGLEFQNIIKSDKDHLRQLNANLVSLHNVTLTGNSSIYGTATANGEYQTGGNLRLDESKTQAVNRRRGIAYLAGKNEMNSAYVRYIHFGQYYDNAYLENNYTNDINVTQDYYLSELKARNQLEQTERYHSTPLAGVVYTNNPDYKHYDNEKIQLGQQVAGSFLLNRSGFHSDLSSQDSNQSTETNGSHNFWVAVYANLADTVSGDGTSLDTSRRLFNSTSNEVNHGYGTDGKAGLSLLAHDNGMMVTNDGHTLMDAFTGNRNQKDASGNEVVANGNGYYNGQVLYLAVNSGKNTGKDIHAVDIDFSKIEEFRSKNDQDIKAFGNTQIGISIHGRDMIHASVPIGDGNTTEQLDHLTFDVDGFDIMQGSNGKVANATYSFYKYLHFDGSYDKDNRTIKTVEGAEGGAGIAYWLKSLNVLDGKQVVLNGRTDPGDTTDPDNYTLSAQLTGKGGVFIPEGNTVIMGDENSWYYREDQKKDEKNRTWFNTYRGETTVATGATLQQGANQALGYTRNLALGENTTYALNGKTQSIGGLQQEKDSTIDFNTLNSSPDQSGQLTITGGLSQNLNGIASASIKGTLTGNSHAVLNAEYSNLSIHTDNMGYEGAVNLTNSIAKLESAKALAAASTTAGTGSLLYLNGADGSGNHYLNNLTNAGTVYLSRQATASTDTLNMVNITGDYKGEGGTLVYNTRLNGDHDSPTDFVSIAGAATGTSHVRVNALPGSNGAQTEQGIHILHAENADSGFALKEGGPIVGGAYYYGLEGRNEGTSGGKQDWYLVNSGEIRSEGGSYINNSLALTQMHMRLHDRMGQAYYSDPFTGEVKEQAAWGRVVGNHTHYRMENGATKTHAETYVTQIGGDLFRKTINDDWKYTIGAFGGALDGRSHTHGRYHAKSEVDGFALGVYGTLYTGNSPDKGFYLDSWLMWGKYDNEIYGSLPKFTYDSDGWVASLEVGKTLPIGETGKAGIDRVVWSWQPQAQVIWDGVKADRAEDSNHTIYRQLGNDNIIFRLGARLHANREDKGLGFIEANWIHNSRKRGVSMNGDRVYQDGARDSGEIRIGAEGHLKKNLLGWITLGVRAGKGGYHEEAAQAGIKYLFE